MNEKHIPILCIDIEEFTGNTLTEQRTILKRIQDILTESARFFMPFGDVWDVWKRIGTGDGYYFLLSGQPFQVALQYARKIDEALSDHNGEYGADLSIRMRMTLVIGDVERVGDQYLSEALSEAERFVSNPQFKRYLKDRSESSTVTCMSALFHTEWLMESRKKNLFPNTSELEWKDFEFLDKHEKKHKGYVQGPGWELTTAEKAPTPRFRILILIAHSLEQHLPEALEMAKETALSLEACGLHIEVRMDIASKGNLKREAANGCDLLFFYGHGNEEGFLSFVDGQFNLSQLGVKDFWENLKGCVVFACHGAQFAKDLPCPWVAFKGPILREAPKGYVRAFIDCMKEHSLIHVPGKAVEKCKSDMTSDFTDLFESSEMKWPEIHISKGEPLFTRLSPNVAGRFHADFFTTENTGQIDYPAHDPFVGRMDELRQMMNIPSIYGDEKQRNVFWISGEAGMGKSALLREYATRISDEFFHEDKQPVYVFQMNCWNYTTVSDLRNDLIKNLRLFYGIDQDEESLEGVFNHIKSLQARHVWVLDDLSYIFAGESGLESTSEAEKLVNLLIDGARSFVISLQIVVSCRRKGPRSYKRLPILPLNEKQALILAARMWTQAAMASGGGINGTPGHVIGGAQRIFQRVNKVTGAYKRAIQLAIDSSDNFMTFADSFDKIGTYNAEQMNELAQELVKFEVGVLEKLENKHGFKYSKFLAAYYDIVCKAGYFTHEEIIEWFDNDFFEPISKKNLKQSYLFGLQYLSRLNYIALENKPGIGAVYVMPPNQRFSMYAIRSHSFIVPEKIPLRGVKERLSMTIERGKTMGLAAIEDFLWLERDYSPHLDQPDVAAAMFMGMRVRAELLMFGNKLEESIIVLDNLFRLFDKHSKHYPYEEFLVREQAVSALCIKGIMLGRLNRSEQKIQVYDEVAERFGERQEAPIPEKVTGSLYNKGVRLGSLNRSEEAILIYDKLIEHFGKRTEAPIAELVARALFNKGARLVSLNRLDEVIQTCDEVIDRFGERPEAPIAELVARALNNKGMALAKLNRSEEAILIYDKLIERFGERSEASIAEQVALALYNKGVRLGKLDRSVEEIKVYDDIFERFGERPEASIAEVVAKALSNKGVPLGSLDRSEKAIQVYDEVVERFGERPETPIVEQVVRALNGTAWCVYKNNFFERFSEAIDRARTAVAKSSNDTLYLHTLACVLGAAGHWDEALEISKVFVGEKRFSEQYLDDVCAFIIDAAADGKAKESITILTASPFADKFEAFAVALKMVLDDTVKAPQKKYAEETAEIMKRITQRREVFIQRDKFFSEQAER